MRFSCHARAVFGRKVKAADELVDEPGLHSAVTIAGAGAFDGANVLPKRLHRLWFDDRVRQSQQS